MDTSPIVAIVFVVFLSLVSLGVIVHFLLNIADRKPDPSQLRLITGLFSVVVTCLVVLLGLMPGVQKAVGSASSSTALIAFNVTGPPAIWLVIFSVTTRVFAVADTTQSDAMPLSAVLQTHYQSLGFRYYRDWFKDLEAFRTVIKPIELHFIDDLLPKVFYHGPYEVTKPADVRISTLFVYAGAHAVKFQRVCAKSRNGMPPSIYLPNTVSTGDGTVSACHFFLRNGELTKGGLHSHGVWAESPYKEVDALLIALYENDVVANGDYIYVDVPKYLDPSQHDYGRVDLALVADRRIKSFDVWEVAASIVSAERPVPLMFRDLYEDVSHTIEANSTRPQPTGDIARLFTGWGAALDQVFDGVLAVRGDSSAEATELRAFTCRVRQVIGANSQRTFQEFLQSPRSTDSVLCQLNRRRNLVLTGVTWSEARTS
jgi:hypothetical protein